MVENDPTVTLKVRVSTRTKLKMGSAMARMSMQDYLDKVLAYDEDEEVAAAVSIANEAYRALQANVINGALADDHPLIASATNILMGAVRILRRHQDHPALRFLPQALDLNNPVPPRVADFDRVCREAGVEGGLRGKRGMTDLSSPATGLIGTMPALRIQGYRRIPEGVAVLQSGDDRVVIAAGDEVVESGGPEEQSK